MMFVPVIILEVVGNFVFVDLMVFLLRQSLDVSINDSSYDVICNIAIVHDQCLPLL